MAIRELYGEAKTAGTDCMSVTFFTVFADVMKKLKAAHKETSEWRENVRLIVHLLLIQENIDMLIALALFL